MVDSSVGEVRDDRPHVTAILSHWRRRDQDKQGQYMLEDMVDKGFYVCGIYIDVHG